MIRRNECFLCKVPLEPVIHAIAKQVHPPADDCEVFYTDEYGIPIDLPEEPEPVDELARESFLDEEAIQLQRFPLVDDVLGDFFAAYQLPRLGGQSSGSGWSSFSLYQRCPYAWKRRYRDKAKAILWTEPPSLAIGSLVHAFLALYYSNMMESSAYCELTPKMLWEYARERANPEFVSESWRVFTGYEIYYKHEQIVPLAVEHDLRDPRTNESCRYDLIAFFPEERPNMLPGTYIVESKTAGRFDWDTLNGWQNDGECLGEVALWQRLGLDKRFGPLRGLMVNILGKQKEQKFHRTIVAPSTWQVDQHLADLKRWQGLINLASSMNVFPRARAGCITRYGACEHWDHCLNNEN